MSRSGSGGQRPDLVGRHSELAALHRWLEADASSSPVMLIRGQPGMGKTMLWSAALDEAAHRGFAVAVSRPSPPEARLAFLVLADLLEGLVTGRPDCLEDLASGQGALVSDILTHAAPSTERTWRAVASAFLSLLRSVSAAQPVALAVDDLQWMDASSLRVLDFALSRCAGAPVRLLATERVGFLDAATVRDPLFARLGPEVMGLGPLAPADLTRVLQRLGPLPRDVVASVIEASGANPYFAIELARSLDGPEGGRVSPLPGPLRRIVASRLTPLSADGLAVCRFACLLGRPTTTMLGALLGAEHARSGLDDGQAAGVLELRGTQWAFTHPLLAAAVDEGIRPGLRRDLHRRAAACVEDQEARAWHLVKASPGPDEAIAEQVTAAARVVAERGAPDNALALVLAAIDLEQSGAADACAARRLDAALALLALDRLPEAMYLAREALGLAADPTLRARALQTSSRAALDLEGPEEAARQLAEAVALPADSVTLVGVIEDYALLLSALGRGAEASALYAANEQRARGLGDPGLIAQTRARTLWDAFQQARISADQALQAADDLRTGGLQVAVLISTVATYDDRPELAFAAWDEILDLAASRGDSLMAAEFTAYRTDLDLRVGNLDRAAEVLGNRHRHETTEPTGAAYEYAQAAYLLAIRGELPEARDEARRAVALAASYPWLRARGLAALGFVEITAGDAVGASTTLRAAFAADPDLPESRHGACWIGIDLIEALAGAGLVAEARAELDRLTRQARVWGHRWTDAGLQRSRSLVALAEGDPATALTHAQAASAAHSALPYPLEQGRSLLLEGILQRRLGHRRAAREALSQSLATFERLGSPPWAGRSRAELGRLGGRSPSTGALTASETLVAEEVALGLSNAQIAAVLHLSVRTVESHLTSVYRKLDVNSRTQLVSTWSRQHTALEVEAGTAL